VGVVRDAKYSRVRGEVPAVAYLPARQDTAARARVFYVRTAGDPDALLRAAPALVGRLDPDLPVEELKTLPAQARENTAGDRLVGTFAGAFAALAAVLAAVGLYGVLAYAVAQRAREFGVRAALGATGGDLRRLVVGQVVRLVTVGGLAGLAAGLAVGRAARALLYGVGAHDPLAVTAAAVLLALVALGAGYLPARRAARADPMRALRYD
jgi:ABC-type antimicrobial peptide transport system permease subunit